MNLNLDWANEQDKIEITDELLETLIACMKKTLEDEKIDFDCQVSLTFTDNAGIHEQNLASRGIDRPTDVLSFPLLETDEDGALIIYEEDLADGDVMLGDILISAERAKEQAEEFGHSLLREMSFLTVHSMLHLLDYDHERGEAEEKEMFQKQDDILNALGITR